MAEEALTEPVSLNLESKCDAALAMARSRPTDLYATISVFGLCLMVVATFGGCRVEESNGPAGAGLPLTTSSPDAWLIDVTSAWGVAFQHDPGDFAAFEMPSIMGSGAALTDFDLDGRLDLYLVRGHRTPADSTSDARLQDGLYRQGPGRKFQCDFAKTGIQPVGFGMGAWWGDVDQDGFPDLLLTNVDGNQFFQNLGDGTFQERKLTGPSNRFAWSTAASWCDVNRDGYLDVFVANYVDYVAGQYCESSDGQRDFCGPDAYTGSVSVLYLNEGSWRDEGGAPFTDVTLVRGLADQRGKALGVLTRDLNGDGRIDLLAANDMLPNDLWIQQPDGSFQQQAELAGLARNFLGQAEANMGVVTGDWNGDGRPDVFITHLAGETNTLYLSAEGYWRDATAVSGLGPPSLPHTGFGVAAVDLEHDGDTDFLVVNGAVKRPASGGRDGPVAYGQPNQLYVRGNGNPKWSEEAALAGPFSRELEIGRALCAFDLDDDGDCDFLLTNCAGPARIYENVAAPAGRWLWVRLIDTRGNREAIGASVVLSIGQTSLLRDVNPYQGYLSQNALAVHFGLGAAAEYDSIEVRWPDGAMESFPGGQSNQRRTLIRETGRQTTAAEQEP